MKNTLTLSLLLLAGSANAQYRAIVPAFPCANNPVISLPKNMPSPLSGPLSGMSIQLPAPTPTPSLSLAAAALPAAAVPAAPITVRLAETAERKDEPKNAIEQNDEKDELDRIFDGELPTRPGRRINIPEREMEQELGL